jgi:hypothetical protein
MIAAGSANHAASLREQTLWQHRRPLRFHSVNMTNFLFDLVSNLALLAIVLSACRLCNRFVPGAMLNGAHIFVALAAAALLLDAALTFLVFADAQNRYGKFSTSSAFFERAGAYVLAAVAALAWQYAARRTRPVKTNNNTLVIRTSPYSESHLPMQPHAGYFLLVTQSASSSGTDLAYGRDVAYNFRRPRVTVCACHRAFAAVLHSRRSISRRQLNQRGTSWISKPYARSS